MNRLWPLLQKNNLELLRTLAFNELALMEQGTISGFFLAFANNVLMLFVFHTLFVGRFLGNVPNPTIYLLLGIVQWNLYVNISMAGFGCFVYRQRLIMGYIFPRELLVFARTAAVFVPYLLELGIIFLVALYFKIPITGKFFLIPLLLVSQYLFCSGLCFTFAYIGVLHKNIVPFWNIMFRLLSFATPIFYVPVNFKGVLTNFIYSINPFTVFMLWIRDIFGANGFPIAFHPGKAFLLALLAFISGYTLYRKMDHNIGDHI